MNIFLYKSVFNWGKDNWCPLDLREYLEYGRRELGRRELRQWWLSWISLKSLRSALSMSSEMKKSEWRRPRRFACLKKASSLDLSVSERSPATAGSAYPTLDKMKAWKIICRESEKRSWALSRESRQRRWLTTESTVSTCKTGDKRYT